MNDAVIKGNESSNGQKQRKGPTHLSGEVGKLETKEPQELMNGIGFV